MCEEIKGLIAIGVILLIGAGIWAWYDIKSNKTQDIAALEETYKAELQALTELVTELKEKHTACIEHIINGCMCQEINKDYPTKGVK